MNHAFNNLPPFLTIYRPFFGCAHRCVLRLAPLCRYPNTHPNPLQNPLGVCVPAYKFSKILTGLAGGARCKETRRRGDTESERAGSCGVWKVAHLGLPPIAPRLTILLRVSGRKRGNALNPKDRPQCWRYAQPPCPKLYGYSGNSRFSVFGATLL